MTFIINFILYSKTHLYYRVANLIVQVVFFNDKVRHGAERKEEGGAKRQAG